MLVHASCAARAGHAVLLLGPPGAGKSDLLLRLLDAGWDLVADDQVQLAAAGAGVLASPPPALAGMLEARGLGLLSGLPWQSQVPVALALRLVPREALHRLPAPAVERFGRHAVPAVALCPWDASVVAKARLALDVALGRQALSAGAFAA